MPTATCTEIDAEAEGRWEITTSSGTVYSVDLDEGLMQRAPGVTNTHPSLRGDGSAVILSGVLNCRVGERGRFLIDLNVEGVQFTVRETTEVLSIRRLG